MARQKNCDYHYKLLMIGPSGCGRTEIIRKWSGDAFHTTFIRTIGMDFKIRNDVIDGTRIKSQIWDLAGQERFDTITSSCYKGAHGIFIVVDLTDRATFDSVSFWLDNVERHTEEDTTKVMILANEFRDAPVQVTPEELKFFAQRRNVALFMKVSTRRNENLEAAFLTMLNAVHEKNLQNLAANSESEGKCALL